MKNRNPRDVIEAKKENPNKTNKQIAEITGYSERQVRRILSKVQHMFVIDSPNENVDVETIELSREVLTLRKQLQKRDDNLRILRKNFRTENRYDNAIYEYVKELVTELDRNPLTTKNHFTTKTENGYEGILQLSDLHFNELVDIKNNKYDFKIASQRLQKFVNKAVMYFKVMSVKQVTIIACGDFINSSRRLDELLSQATNRTRATLLACELLEHVICDLNQHFNIRFAYVTGNESRVEKEITYSDVGVSDNYDTMIAEILRYRFRGKEGIEFLVQDNVAEIVIHVNGKNVLVMHGESIGKETHGTLMQKIRGKWADAGVLVDFIIFGHFHSTVIADTYARSSSLVGANAYSDSGLNLTGRSSQLIHLISPINIDSIKIDLQDYDSYEGYDIDDSLIIYDTKSVSKVLQKKVI